MFNDKGQLLYFNVTVYILVQSEEECSLIWKAKPLTIQFDKTVNGKKVDPKGKNDKTMDSCDVITNQMTSYIIIVML